MVLYNNNSCPHKATCLLQKLLPRAFLDLPGRHQNEIVPSSIQRWWATLFLFRYCGWRCLGNSQNRNCGNLALNKTANCQHNFFWKYCLPLMACSHTSELLVWARTFNFFFQFLSWYCHVFTVKEIFWA